MSRKITKKSVAAFLSGFSLKEANMQISNYNNETHMYLHGNLIAKRAEGGLYITASGWQSNTTKERLNALPGVSIQQKARVWYLNGKKWDGQWIKISG